MIRFLSAIPLSEIRPNPWNPNRMDDEMYRKELASFRKFGYVNPILTRQLADGSYQIIDGEHRHRALLDLGRPSADIIVIDGIERDEDAKQLTIILNETRGRPEPDKLGALLADLLSAGIPKTDLLDVLPFGPAQFDKLTGLTDFDWDALPKPGSDSRWVERTYRLPADAAEVIDDALEAAKGEQGELEDWQALECIAADYLASTRTPVGASTAVMRAKEPMGRV